MSKIDDIQAYKEWTEYYRSFKRDKVADNLSPMERKKKLEKLEANVIEWILFSFSEFVRYPFIRFYKKTIEHITTNTEWYGVLSWSRKLAKSTIVFMCMVYLVLTGRKKSVLLISNSHKNAVQLLRPYKKAFESNSILKAYYGDLREFGSWTANEFVLTTRATFRAIGTLKSPRGTRKDAVRPDTALVDSFDADADCRNPNILRKKWKWFKEILFPTRSISEDLLVIFCGSLIALDCCVRHTGDKADHWDTVSIRDKDGKSDWPEKSTEGHISRTQSKISTKTSQQEYMNSPLSKGDTFREMVWGKCPPLSKLQFAVVYGNPAPSSSKNEATSFKTCFLIGYYNGKFYIYTGYLDHVINKGYVNWCYYLRDYVGQKTQVYNYIEDNKLQDPFYEQVFVPLFSEKGKQLGLIGIISDTRKEPGKFDRIGGNLEPTNRQGQLILSIDEKDSPHMKRLEEQFLLINRAMKSPADGVDCIEGGMWIINQKISTLLAGSYIVDARATNKKRF